MVPDATLLGRIVDQDRDAFSVFYDRYSSVVYGVCRRILGDGPDAEDVVQDVFLQVWREASRFDATRASVKTWLFTIGRSRALDRYRSRASVAKRVQAVPEDLLEARGTDHPAELNLLAQHVRRLVQQLSIPERQVLALAYYEGLTQVEIAERLKEPLGTVKGRARAGLRKLHALMTGEEQHG